MKLSSWRIDYPTNLREARELVARSTALFCTAVVMILLWFIVVLNLSESPGTNEFPKDILLGIIERGVALGIALGVSPTILAALFVAFYRNKKIDGIFYVAVLVIILTIFALIILTLQFSIRNWGIFDSYLVRCGSCGEIDGSSGKFIVHITDEKFYEMSLGVFGGMLLWYCSIFAGFLGLKGVIQEYLRNNSGRGDDQAAAQTPDDRPAPARD